MDKMQLGDRMKENYEKRCRSFLTRRTPVIIRIDGRAFHTFTRGMKRPYDENLNEMMRYTTIKLCEEIQGAKCAYTQSDEISILITDYDKLNTSAWFDYNVQKITSVSASVATAQFNRAYFKSFLDFNAIEFSETQPYEQSMKEIIDFVLRGKTINFDSRAFNIPKEEVNNYFIWRQEDWVRNSIQLMGQANYSHKQLEGMSCNKIREKVLEEKNINWWHYEDKWKNGSLCIKNNDGWDFVKNCPIFKEDRDSINNLVYIGE